MMRRKYFLIILLIMVGWRISGVGERFFQTPKAESEMVYLSIEPAEITEPLKTWYLGAVAFEAPESLKQIMFSVKFHPDDLSEATAFEFEELQMPWVPGEDQAPVVNPPMPDDRVEMLPIINQTSEKLGEEDISSILGRPAGLSVYFYSKAPVFTSLSPKEPDKHFLRFSVVVRQGEGLLKFTRSEQLEQDKSADVAGEFVQQRKEAFIKMVSDFLDVYHWTDSNQLPAANQLTTGYGYIDISNGWPESVIEFSAIVFFDTSEKDKRIRMLDSFKLGAKHIQGLSSSENSRQNLIPTSNTIFSLPEKDDIYMYQERRKRFDLGDQDSVLARLDLMALPLKDDKVYQSYLMGVLNTVFKTIRPAGEGTPSSDGLGGGEK